MIWQPGFLTCFSLRKSKLACRLKIRLFPSDLTTCFLPVSLWESPNRPLGWALAVDRTPLTVLQSQAIERVQKTCLKIILGPEYTSYADALEYTGLEKLSDRREARCLQFGLKCLVRPIHSRMFPVNPQLNSDHKIRQQEHFVVNKARTEYYKLSAIPYIQRKLNQYVKAQNSKDWIRICNCNHICEC